ncbi:unnamed protein product [Urochloa humidicola]
MATMKTVLSLLFMALLLAPLAVPHTCNEHSIGEGATRGEVWLPHLQHNYGAFLPYTNSSTCQLNGKKPNLCQELKMHLPESTAEDGNMSALEVHHLCLN